MRKKIGQTANGIVVYMDTQRSHAATHLSGNKGLLDIVVKVLGQTSTDAKNVYLDQDMGMVVGETDLVETTEKDEIVYAKRRNRDNFTRFAMNRDPEPTSYVTVVLSKDTNKEYELVSAWVGRAVPQFPGDKFATPESRTFWRSHALAWGRQAIQADTVRKNWPWG